MSFREKMVWVTLAVTLAVWGWYFVRVWGALADGEATGAAILGLFVRAVVLTIVLEVVVAIALAAAAPKAAEAPADERERLIELRATRTAYVILSVGVIGVALSAPMMATAGPQLLADPTDNLVLILGNALLFALIGAELIKGAAQVVGFRRGA